jgi:hypothetical protein
MVRSLTRGVVPAPAVAAAIALILGAVVAVASLRPVGWTPSALVQVGAGTRLGPIAKGVDPGFHTVGFGGYDGQFYWAVALDPLARNDVHRAVDRPEYRYGHPLLGWLGWVASAGRARDAAAALLALGLASLAAAAAASAALARVVGGGRAGSALFVACNAGLLYSATHALAEPLAAALLLGGLAAYATGRRRLALMCLAAGPLAREQLVLVPLAVVAWELVARRRSARASLPWLGSLAPAIVWWIYLRLHLGGWFTTGSSALGAPLAGWRRALADAGAASYAAQGSDAQLVVLVALHAILAVAGVFALRLRDPLDVFYVALGALTLCLAPNATLRMTDALRNTAVLVALVPFALRRSGSAGAFAGRALRRAP